MTAVIFDDPQLQQHCERVISLMKTLPEELLPVFGLMDAYSWFKTIEGINSVRGQEIMKHLTSKELREPLKKWYLRHTCLNPAADEFRRVLEITTGDKLPLGSDV